MHVFFSQKKHHKIHKLVYYVIDGYQNPPQSEEENDP
jgi:hypothetical protein